MDKIEDKEITYKIEKINRCQKTIFDMIKVRGFNIPESYNNITLDQTTIQYHENSLNYKLYSQDCFVKVDWLDDISKVNKSIKNFLTDLHNFLNKIWSTNNDSRGKEKKILDKINKKQYTFEKI